MFSGPRFSSFSEDVFAATAATKCNKLWQNFHCQFTIVFSTLPTWCLSGCSCHQTFTRNAIFWSGLTRFIPWLEQLWLSRLLCVEDKRKDKHFVWNSPLTPWFHNSIVGDPSLNANPPLLCYFSQSAWRKGTCRNFSSNLSRAKSAVGRLN